MHRKLAQPPKTGRSTTVSRLTPALLALCALSLVACGALVIGSAIDWFQCRRMSE